MLKRMAAGIYQRPVRKPMITDEEEDENFSNLFEQMTQFRTRAAFQI